MDETLSLATCRDGQVRVRLRLDTTDWTLPLALCATAGSETVEAAAHVDGRDIRAEFDKAALLGRAWTLSIRPGPGSHTRAAGARLLVPEHAPVALVLADIPGAKPGAKPAAPGRPAAPQAGAAPAATGTRRAVVDLGRRVDRTVQRWLPPTAARSVHARLRRIARRARLV